MPDSGAIRNEDLGHTSIGTLSAKPTNGRKKQLFAKKEKKF